MLKKFAALFSTLAVALAFFSCTPDGGSSTLATPELSVSGKTGTSLTISWPAVQNADAYTVIKNSDEPITVTKTSVTFSNLTAGEYTIKVAATSSKEDIKDSEFAVIKETLTGIEDEWIRMNVTLEPGFEYIYVTATWTAPKKNVTGVLFSCVESSLTKDIADDQLYDFLSQQTEEKNSIYELPEEYLKELNSKGQFSLTLNSIRDIEPETEYEVIAIATNKNESTSILRATQATAKKPESHPELQKWLGEWEVTSDYGVRFFLNPEENNELYFGMPKDDSVFTYTIKVEEDPLYTNYALIYGLSDSDPDQPLTAVFDTSTVAIDFETGEPTGEKKPRQLILAGNNAVERDDRGNYVTWIIMASYEDVEDGKEKVTPIPLSWGTTPAFIMEMKEDGSVFSTPYPMGASTEDGKKFDLNILSIGLLLETPSGDMDIITAADKEDTFHYGGNFIWTRKGADITPPEDGETTPTPSSFENSVPVKFEQQSLTLVK